MKRKTFDSLLATGNLQELFISEMGWNNPQGQTQLPPYNIDDVVFDVQVVAQRNGFQILTARVTDIPKISVARKLDAKLRRQANDYILIFTIPQSEHHCWVCPVKNIEKRELVSVEYAELKQADFLFSKMDGLCFDYDEATTIIDVRERVQKAFTVNSEKITKVFYAGFRKEHRTFASFIEGIDIDKDKQWYTSVMLNRLMFCYFIQKKGFLDGDTDYLPRKLREVRELRGENKFYHTFYIGFLIQLFHDGLNSPSHSNEFVNTYGRIPYLNGGLFDIHLLERKYDHIDIPDEAFERLFAFFDTWQWHLDTRITASGKDINPDVLGYIFEQYINDRAAMGAYYTKEDITEYISKNCILPFLFDRVADSPSRHTFKPNGEVWALLRDSGMKYIYDAVKKGYTPDWRQRVPDNIARGIDTAQPNLLERRKDWNTPTSEAFALPTEIWRETIERFQRCDTLVEKISSGGITAINDFITLNLNIRLFAEDLLANTHDHRLIANFYHAMRHITILDPTCGSGAFLFAAMNILEPLYETCINRMHEFCDENPNLFKEELGEIDRKYRSNIQYFIYKNIILRNLYGVDIMAEATEIAKLRLFLKMVAVVEVDPRADNMGLDPLPDIDFNIRCGNTLVGYATEQELEKSLIEGDAFARQEFEEKVNTEMKVVATAYKIFKQLQMVQEDNMSTFKQAKQELGERLSELNELLNRHMYGTFMKVPYEDWLASHQPFHWLAEFYDIIQGNGGFDVIIGNPPYVSMSQISYLKVEESYRCSDLYAFVIRRGLDIIQAKGTHGFVVMHNIAFSKNFADLRKLLYNHKGSEWFSFYSRIPSGLFSGDVRVRNCIYLLSSNGEERYTTRMHRWFAEQRESLFTTLTYNQFSFSDVVPMLNSSLLQEVYEQKKGLHLSTLIDRMNGQPLYFKQVAYNWLSVGNIAPPAYDKNDANIEQTELGTLNFQTEKYEYISLLLAGKLYTTKWLSYGDDFHLTANDLLSFSYPFDKLSEDDKKTLHLLYVQFVKALPKTVQFKLNAGRNVGTFNTMKLWFITDQSDRIFCKYLGENSETILQLVQSHIAKCVISVKKDKTASPRRSSTSSSTTI